MSIVMRDYTEVRSLKESNIHTDFSVTFAPFKCI